MSEASQLTAFLQTVSQLERKVEEERLKLANLVDFEPYSVFRTINQNKSLYISVDQLKTFLDDEEFEADEDQLQKIIEQYQGDDCGFLTYNEFCSLVLPTTDLNKRIQSLSKISYLQITDEVKNAVIDVLQAEIKYQNEFRQQKNAFKPENLANELRQLTGQRQGAITNDLLQKILGNVNDVNAVLRRLDEDADGELSYNELQQHFGQQQKEDLTVEDLGSSSGFRPGYIRSTNQQSQLPSSSYLADQQRRETYESPTRANRFDRIYEPVQNSQTIGGGKWASPVRDELYSPQRNAINQSPNRQSQYQSPNRPSIDSSPSRHQRSPLTPNEEAEVARSFKEQINLSRDLENAKDELSLRVDFNLSDAYNLFDPTNKGHITTFDFEQALTDYFGVYQVRDEINLLIRHYGKFNETRLRYSEFIQLFTPKRHDYSSLLRSRQGAVYPSTVQDIFGPLTKAKLISVIRLHLESEGASERLRQRLTRRSSFSLYEAFQAVDRDRNGYITINEFKEILLDHGIYTNVQDLESLMERYDKNQDGKVSYSEFIQEVTPKSPRRY